MLRGIVSFSFLKSNWDVAPLALRLGLGINLFLKHGWEKIAYFNVMAPNFFDPLGMGHYTTFLMAFFSDVICSILFILGAGTRWWCMYCFGLIMGAWALRHHFLYWGLPPGVPGDHLKGDHGELIMFFFTVLIVLFIDGPGKYSINAWLMRSDSRVSPASV